MSTNSIDRSIFAKPSTLARAALADLERVEADPRFVIRMGQWLGPATIQSGESNSVHTLGQRVCGVCMAGAVMAQSCGLGVRLSGGTAVSLGDELRAAGYTDTEIGQIFALDDLRCGEIEEYACNWEAGKDSDRDLSDFDFYDGSNGSDPDEREEWKAEIRAAIDCLESVGL
jgi:hypothetical protein